MKIGLSDISIGFIDINITFSNIEKGFTILTGTNQGLFARVKKHPDSLVVRSTMPDGRVVGPHAVPMERDTLLEEAESGGFFSYCAGVAYQLLTYYHVKGLEIDNYKTTLPIKKGLSSSAAVSVLVARAFNRVYDLKMTVRGEMEFAYMGEITTPSRCGRMDQGCAYGARPIMMTFDGDRMDVKALSVKRDLFFVIVDLGASKDTKEILNKLNHCYPFADDEVQKMVQQYLGGMSLDISKRASAALEAGDAELLGELMTEAQAGFDKHVAPACPSQLKSPVLHKVLAHEPLRQFVYGGKGVGSQGDGSAQFVAKDEDSQSKAIELIERDLGLSCLKLALRSAKRVRKAVIPAAGFGTRLFPATKAVKKELFPVIDRDGLVKPVILVIVEEALKAGIEDICIIVQSSDRQLFEDFFGMPPAIENYNKLSNESKAVNDHLLEVGSHVSFVCQDVQEGFGHAVNCARDWVGDEPFLLMLGDHLYRSDGEKSCIRQMIDAYEQLERSVVGLKATPASDVHNFGCVGGSWIEKDRLLSLTEFREKPDADYARTHLAVDGLAEDMFFSVFGLYLLESEIFGYLSEQIENNIREGGEFQLTSCLDRLRQEKGFGGCVIDGRRFDVGLPESYRQAMIDFAAE